MRSLADCLKIHGANLDSAYRKSIIKLATENKRSGYEAHQAEMMAVASVMDTVKADGQAIFNQLERVGPVKEKKDDVHTAGQRGKTESERRSAQEQKLESVAAQFGAAGQTEAVVPTSKAEKAFQKVAGLFGLDAVFFRTNNDIFKSVGGFMDPNMPSDIFVNTENQKPLEFLVGHETLHQLKVNNEKLYNWLKNEIIIPDKKFRAYVAKHLENWKGSTATEKEISDAIKNKESRNYITEELLADFAGDQFKNPAFWKKMAGKNKSFTQQIIDVINKILDRITRSDTYGTQYIKNFQTSQDALVSAMSAFADSAKITRKDKGYAEGKRTIAKAGDAAVQKDLKFSRQSTRVPKAKSATENALDDLLTVDYDLAINDKANLAKVVTFFKTFPNLRPTRAKDEIVAENMVDHMKDNILWVHDQVPEAIRERSRLWYDGANRIAKNFSKKYGISEMQAAGVLATLSPNNEWPQNVSVAERALDIVSTKQNFKWTSAMAKTFRADNIPGGMSEVKGKKLKDVLSNPKAAAKWVRTYDHTYNDRSRTWLLPEGGTAGKMMTATGVPAKTAWGSYGEIGKAISILMDGRAENIHYQLSWSHKVRNFYNNIYDPASDKFVTIDTHAIGVSFLQSFGGAHLAVRHVFGGGAKSSITGLQGSYVYHAEAYKRAAAERGILPREMQSIVWVGKQALFGRSAKVDSKKGKAIANLWAQHKKGKLTQAEVQAGILEITGGMTEQAWWSEPYNDKFETTYPKEDATIKKLEKFPGKDIRVAFEVAPHPDNAALQTAWAGVTEEQRAEISQIIAAEITPKILKEFSTSGELQLQVGGYEGAGNVGFGLKVENSALTVPIAKMLGYSLSQKEMVVASDKKIPGTDKVDIITISLPEGYSVDKIHKLYYDLYGLVDAKGNHLVEGHTTTKDQMAILNFTGLNSNALKTRIKKRLEKFAPDEDFKISVDEGYSALINEREYDYDSYRPRTAEETAAGSPLLRRPDRFRKEASERLAEELKRAGVKFSKGRNYKVEQSGKERLERLREGGEQADRAGSQRADVQLTHYGRTKGLQKLDPARHGQGLIGAESRRKAEDPDHWIDRTYYGLPGYKKEPGLGSEKYTASVTADELYDFVKDPDNLKPKAEKIVSATTSGWPPNFINVYEQLISQAGYSGYSVREVAAVFKALEVTPDVKFSKAFTEGPKADRIAAMTAARDQYSHEDFFIEDMMKKQKRKRTSFKQPLARKLGGKYSAKVRVPKDIASYVGDYGHRITVGDQSVYFIASSEGGAIYLPNVAVDGKGAGLGKKFMTALKDVADSTGQDINIYKVSNPEFFEKLGWLEKDKFGDFKYTTPEKDWLVGVSELMDIWNSEGQPKFSKSRPEDTQEFKTWSRGYEVLDSSEIADAPTGEGLVFKVYHGTTNGFNIFDPTVKGTKEGQFGQVNYFTSDQSDADLNYAGTGPDLTNRIEQRKELVEDELSNYDEEEIAELAEEYGLEFDPETETYPADLPEAMARAELHGGDPQTKFVFVKADNPAFIGGPQETWIENLDLERYRDDAIEEVMHEEDVSREVAEEEYYNQIQDKIYEMSAYDEPPLLVAIRDAVRDANATADPNQIYTELELYDPDVAATELEDRLRASEELMYAEDYDDGGYYIQPHVIGQVFKHLGFDAIVLQNANERFRGMDMGGQTAHVHVFAETPQNIKLADDVTYDDAGQAIPPEMRFSESSDIRFSKVSPALVKKLEAGKKIKVYRAMQLIDGKLYPPMSAKVEGKLREPTEIGQWEQAEENPGLADDKGYFKLDKGNKKSIKARYNPYFHASASPLNDQFSSAYDRPNLVTVEVEIPASELSSGYKAEKAKNTVGEQSWNNGPVSSKLPGDKKRTVILSRYAKAVRVVPDSEVAEKIADILKDQNIPIPDNVITPSLRNELQALGVPTTRSKQVAKAEAKADQLKFSIAYHGTPHVWPPEPGFPHGRPRLDKIGTGEGFAAYGWGWYSADKEKTAGFYADTYGTEPQLKKGTADTLRLFRKELGGNAENLLRWAGYDGSAESLSVAIDALAKNNKISRSLAAKAIDDGKAIYKLDIPDSVIPKLLDWDAPLSEQSEYVKKKIEPTVKRFEKDMEDRNPVNRKIANGQDLYNWVRAEESDKIGWASSQQAASEYIASIGVPGNRYLDGMSRNKGEGSYNYVIWDQKVLDQIALLERNGEKLDAIRAEEAADQLKFSKVQVTAREAEGEGGVTRLKYTNNDGVVVGQARQMGSTIGDIEVKEKFRRQGFGEAMVRDLVERGGTTAIPVNEASKALFEKAGFKKAPGENYYRHAPESQLKFSKTATKTPAFKKWFGKSEITNPDGSPRVVYHGTKELFSEFKAGFDDRLSFFSTNPEFASVWAAGRRKKPENLRNFAWTEKNEKELNDHWADFHKKSDELYDSDKDEWIKQYDKLKRTSPPRKANVESDADAAVYPVYVRAEKMFNPEKDFKLIEDTLRAMPSMDGIIKEGRHKEGHWIVYENKAVIDKIESLGYDGIWLRESPLEGSPTETIAVWNATQIKSATGNTGAFDPLLSDIRFSKTDPELTKAGQAEIDRIITRLRQYVKKDEMGVSESKTRKLATQYVSLKKKLADRHTSTESKIKEFKSLLMQMPMNVRGKSLAGFNKLASVKNEETKERHFQKLRIQAEKEVNKHFKRETLKAINKMRKLKVKVKGHRKTNIGAPAARVLEYVNQVLMDPKLRSVAGQEEHIAKLKARLEALEGRESTPVIERQILNTKDKIEVAEVFGGYGEATLSDLEHAYTTLETLIMEGRTMWQLAEAERKAMVGEITNKVIQDVTGKENPEPETPAEKRRRESKEDKSTWFKIKRGLSNFDTLHQSWHFLLDKITTRGEGRTLRTETVELLGGSVHAATNKESELNQTAVSMIQDKLEELTGLKGRKLEKWISERSELETEYSITSTDRSGKEKKETIPLSDMQAVYWWAINRRGNALAAEGFDSVNERLELMGVTPEFLKKVETTVDPIVLDLAEWLSDTMGGFIWQNANHVHEARYGASIPNSVDYTPIRADYNVGRSEADLLQRQSRGSSMIKGALHDLTSTKMGVKPANLLDVWTNHINDMNHFTAWAIPVQQLEGVFGNQALRNFIEQHYGKEMNGKIADFIEIFKGSPVGQKDHLSKMAVWRGKFSTAVLGLNPAIYLKQLSSIPAMAADIPIMDWNKGMASFMANPKKAIDILSESQFVKTRRGQGHTRDVAAASAKSIRQLYSGGSSLPTKLMLLVRMGDMQAIYAGGWSVYKYYNDKYTSQGMSKSEAHKKALARFEQTALQTQQTGEKYGMSLIQQGSALQQLFTMFMSAPVSYYREVGAAIRNMKKAPKDSVKRLALFWVVVPAMFSAIANAPLAFDDDDEDQELFWKRLARDTSLGPISGLFFVRDIAKYLYNTVFLQEENWSGLGFSSMGQPVETVNKMLRQMVDLAEGEDVSWSDFNEDLIDIAGYTTGLPLPAAQNYVQGVRQIAKGETEHPTAKMMGYTNWATGDKGEDVALTKFAKKKKRVKKIADGLEDAEDKRAYRQEHKEDLRLHGRIGALQPRLNKLRRRINDLKKKDSTEKREALIETLENRRTEMVRRFLEREGNR